METGKARAANMHEWILRRGRGAISVAIFALLVSSVSTSSAQDTPAIWEFSTGADYSVGEYGGASDTTVFAVPFGVKVQMDRVRAEASISYLSLEGPGAFAGGPGAPVIVDPSNPPTTSRSGIGDTNLGLAIAIYRTPDAASGVELSGSTKLPTAKSGLGTGKTDFTGQLNFYHSLSPGFILSGGVGYQWLQDFQGFGLKDGFLGNVGLNLWPHDSKATGLTLSYREEPWTGIGEQLSLAPYVSWRASADWGITAYGTLGLTDASAEYGTGLRLTAFR